MNNRSPFIPNIPTPQGHWSDPSQLFNTHPTNQPNIPQIQVPFTAHQQMQLQSQHHQSSSPQSSQLYNVGFINTTSSSPINSSSNIFTSDPWAAANLNVSSLSNQVNYSYHQLNQQVNYQQQLQHQQAQVQVMQNIVNQSSPRGMPMQLTLDTPHFVHFPVNLSPPGSAMFSQSPQRSSGRSSNNNNSIMFSGGNNSPPSSPLSLVDSRSMSGSMESLYVHPTSSSPALPLALNSRSSSGGNNNNNMQTSSNMLNSTYLQPFLNLPSHLSGTPPMSFSSSSSPPSSSSCVQRSPNMSPFSSGGGSPSPSPTPQSHGNRHLQPAPPTSSYSSTQVPFNQFSPGSGSGRINHRLPSPSPIPVRDPSPQYFSSNSNSRSQTPPAAHMPSRQTTTLAGGVYVPPLRSPNSRPPVQYQQQQHVIHQHKAPSPPPPKVKKPRAPRKKKEPQKPIPLNPTPSQQGPPPATPITPLMASHLSMPNLSNSWSHVLDLPSGHQAHLGLPLPPLTRPFGHQQPGNFAATMQQPPPLPRPVMTTYMPPAPAGTRATTPSLINQSLPPQPVIRSSVIQTTTLSSSAQTTQTPTPRQSTPLTVTASPQRAPQRRTSQPKSNNGNTTTLSSPTKMSMLDYALEKAGIKQELFGDGESSSETTAVRASGDFDLELELNRFYSPPSPSKDKSTAAAATISSTPPVSTSIAKTTLTTTPTPTRSSSQPTTTTTVSSAQSKSKPPPAFTPDDDDCEVILVKLSAKSKRKLTAPPGRRAPPNKRMAGGAQSPRPGVPLPNRPNVTLTVSAQPRLPALNKRGVAATAPEPKGKSMVRAAYPNGRYVAVAPKTTVPIPPRGSNTTSKTNATARKSTAPIPPSTNKRAPLTPQRPGSNTRQQRSKRAPVEDDNEDLFELHPSYSYPEPEKKLTRQAARALLKQGINKDELYQSPKTDSPNRFPKRGTGSPPRQSTSNLDKQLQPPIKMKLNLKDGTAKSVVASPSKRPGPKSKTNISVVVTPASSSSPKVQKKTTSVEGAEDDLLIVDEFLANSDDDSYDPDGERDEASTESESEPDDEDSAHFPGIRKKKTSPAKRLKSDDEVEKAEVSVDDKPVPTGTTNLDKPSKLPPPREEEEIDNNMTSAPFDDGYDSPTSSFSPPSPPFKNIVLDPDNDKVETSNKIPEIQPVIKEAIKASTVQIATLVESDDDDDDDSEVEEIIKFEMPKPAVIIKGTKEDADKAVNTMRETLAQLTKFKMPFFGR